MFSRRLPAAALACLLAVPIPLALAGRADEPDVVIVQHVLIGYKRSVPGTKLERKKGEAEELAYELLARAQEGEDFDAIVKEYTNDRYPGIYKLTNRGAPLMDQARPRDKMVANFGDVAFSLEVGEVGVAKFHAGNSPYGWHVIKRLE